MRRAHDVLLTGLMAVSLMLPLAAQVFAADPPPLSDRDKRQMADEVKQGSDIAAEIAKAPTTKFCTDKDMLDRVNRIGQRLAAVANTTSYQANFGNDKVYPFTWHFYVIKSEDVNAFSLPGGYVYVYSGLLKLVRSDDELAGILGHEITHSAHHHIQELTHEQSKMGTQMLVGLLAAVLAHVPSQDIGNLAMGASMYTQAIQNLKYSQNAERDADHGGVILMQKAGYNPLGMLTFMQVLEDREKRSPEIVYGIYLDHPLSSERTAALRAQLTAMNVPQTPAAYAKVEGAPRAVASAVNGQIRAVSLGSETLFTLADPDGSRSAAAAVALNKALDAGLQMFEVHAQNGALYASNYQIVAMTAADVALTPGSTPDTLAQSANRHLQKVLWKETIVGERAAN